jgi:hypothetical protein
MTKRVHIVTLEIPPQTKPIRLKVRNEYYDPTRGDPDDAYDGQKFWYEENTCAVNWIHNVVEIALGDNRDPHRLVEMVDIEPVIADRHIEALRKMPDVRLAFLSPDQRTLYVAHDADTHECVFNMELVDCALDFAIIDAANVEDPINAALVQSAREDGRVVYERDGGK